MAMKVGSILVPVARILSGLWFLNSSAQLVWKCLKSMSDNIRMSSPRFTSGRVGKFYKFTPPRVKRRREREKKVEERKNFRKVLFLVDSADAEYDQRQVNSSVTESKDIDMKQLVGQNFSFCSSQCCSEMKESAENGSKVINLMKLNSVLLVKDDLDPSTKDKDIHIQTVEDIGLECISSDSGDCYSHTSKSPSREAPFVTSTPCVPNTIPVLGSLVSTIVQGGLNSCNEEPSVGILGTEVDDKHSLWLFSSPNSLMSESIIQGDTLTDDTISENMPELEDKDEDTKEVEITDLFKPFSPCAEDVALSIVDSTSKEICVEDSRVAEDTSLEDAVNECSTESDSKLYIHISY